MSPTVLRQDGYKFGIYVDDHPPAHVHVKSAGKEAKVSLDPVDVKANYGFSVREKARIVNIVSENQMLLLAEWDKYHEVR